MQCYLLFFAIILTTFSCNQPEKERYGTMTIHGEIITPAIYDGAELTVLRINGFEKPSDRFHVVSKGNKKGVIGPDGKQVGKIEFDDISPYFSYPLYQVFKKGKTGFMNQQGEISIPCIYDEYEHDDDEYNDRYILNRGGKYGMVDGNNTIILPFEYSAIDNYESTSHTLNYYVCKNGKYALANRKGEVLTPFKYDKITLFPRGGGLAEIGRECCFLSALGEEIVDEPGEYIIDPVFIYDLDGLVAIQGVEGFRFYTYEGKQLDNVYKGISVDRFSDDGLMCIIMDLDEYIVIDTLTRTITDKYYPETYKRFIEFRDGLAIVGDASERVGVIDTKGELVIPFEDQRLKHAPSSRRNNDKYASFLLKRNDYLYNILTRDGKLLNDQLYSDVFYYADRGFIAVEQWSGKGVISLDGDEILPCEYQEIHPLDDELLMFETKTGKRGFYNIRTGNSLPPEFDRCGFFSEQPFRMVEKDGRQGVITSQCEWVLPCQYQRVEITSDNYFIVTNDDNVSAILDADGKVIRPFGKETLFYLWDDILLFKITL